MQHCRFLFGGFVYSRGTKSTVSAHMMKHSESMIASDNSPEVLISMLHEHKSQDHQGSRSEYIRQIVQQPTTSSSVSPRRAPLPPKTIVQFWHDLKHLPLDVEDCIQTWAAWKSEGFGHHIFEESAAEQFIARSLGPRHKSAFERCYHPAMKSDYFRLCYIFLNGGLYVDADDVCITDDLNHLTEDGRLKLQPLCYDVGTATMVPPQSFLAPRAFDPQWIFYFNNNPLIAGPGHPVIELALEQATLSLGEGEVEEFPEIQSATGPGNISRSIFELGMNSGYDLESHITVLGNWESLAVSKWPLSYRNDARNWRLSNQTRFDGGKLV
jgi:mannosyltransferase OCH1-like enzyme